MAWQKAAMAVAAREAARRVASGYRATPSWVKLVGAGVLVGGGVYLGVKYLMPSKWLKRMSERDVQVAAYFVGLVGPDNLWQKLKKAVNPVEWAKTWGNDISNFFFGTTVEAIKRGIDRATDWALVEEAYSGLTKSALWNDISKKVNQKEFLELQDYHKRRFDRQREHQVTVAGDRAKLIGAMYENTRHYKPDTIYRLGPSADQFKQWRIAAFVDTTGKSSAIGRPKGTKRFKAKQYIGALTNRVVKDRKGKLWMEVASVTSLSGPMWFLLDDLDLYK